MLAREDPRAAELDPEIGGAVHGAVEARQKRGLAGPFEREGDEDGCRGREAFVGRCVGGGGVEGEGDRGVVARCRCCGVGDGLAVEQGEEELRGPAGAEDEEVDVGRGPVEHYCVVFLCGLARTGGFLADGYGARLGRSRGF